MGRVKATLLGTVMSAAVLAAGALSVFAADKVKDSTCLTNAHGEQCTIAVHEAHPACTESAKVIKTLKLMASLLAKGDLKGYAEYLADGCTTFDEGSGKLIVGKEAVVADMKKRMEEANPGGGKEHVITLTILEPYARVTGDVATVTFKAIKEVAGPHPEKSEVSATDVFVRHGNKWQKLHFRGEWKKIS